MLGSEGREPWRLQYSFERQKIRFTSQTEASANLQPGSLLNFAQMLVAERQIARKRLPWTLSQMIAFSQSLDRLR